MVRTLTTPLIPSAVACLLALASSAQITVTQADMPTNTTNLVRTRALANPFVNFTNTGPNQNWNYATLQAQGQENETYQSLPSTGIPFVLVFSDFFLNPNRANHVKPGTDGALIDLLPVDNPYTFRFRNASVYKTVGYGFTVAGLPLPVVFDQHDVIYQLPLQFGNSFSGTSSWNVSLPDLFYYGYSQTRTTTVDGWGTVTTPGGTWNALRVKSVIDGRDSIQVDALSLGFAIDRPRVTEYKWLANGVRTPVLQINTTRLLGQEIITEILFFDQPRSLSVGSPLASTLCPGQAVQVPYTATGSFNLAQGFLFPGNVFRAQLSNANGSFANPVNIGQVTATTSGVINATIPANTPPGSGYRIRVIATSPAFTGSNNGFDITVGSPPVATAQADGPTTFCAGNAVPLIAGNGDGYSYQWNLGGTAIPGADQATFTATASGSYTVSVSNACGSVASNAISVQVNALPVFEPVLTSVALCAADEAVLETVNISGLQDLTFQWSVDGDAIAGAESPVLSVSQAGTYTMDVLDPSTGCTWTTAPISVEVETVTPPSLITNGVTTFCAGGSVVLEAASPDAATYAWSVDGTVISGEEGANLTAASSGSYTAVAVSVSGCVSTSSDPIAVEVVPLPTTPEVEAASATAFCDGGSVVLSVNAGNLSVQWFLDDAPIAGANDATYTTASAGSFTAVVTDALGCASGASAPVDVTVFPFPAAPEVEALDNTVVCAGNLVQLQLVGDAQPGTYQWTLDGSPIPGANGLFFFAQTSGNHALVLTSPNGCTSDASNTIGVGILEVPATPTITTSGSTTFCDGANVILSVPEIPGYLYAWVTLEGVPVNEANTPSVEAVVSGTYLVTVTNPAGCSASADPVAVVVLPTPDAPQVEATDNTTVCPGSVVQLQLVVDVEDGSYQWTLDGEPVQGATATTFIANVSGDYALVLTSADGCSSEPSNIISVLVLDGPGAAVIAADGPTTFCAGASVLLSVPGVSGVTYAWSTLEGLPVSGADQAVITADQSANYTVTITDADGCSAQASPVAVTVLPLPAQPVINADVDQLTASGTGPFQWFLNGEPIAGATGATITATVNGTYTVTVTGTNGCSITSEPFAFTGASVGELDGGFQASVYPSPNNGQFFLRLPAHLGANVLYTISAMNGQQVAEGRATGELTTVHLSGAAPGVYVVRCFASASMWTGRVVVER